MATRLHRSSNSSPGNEKYKLPKKEKNKNRKRFSPINFNLCKLNFKIILPIPAIYLQSSQLRTRPCSRYKQRNNNRSTVSATAISVPPFVTEFLTRWSLFVPPFPSSAQLSSHPNSKLTARPRLLASPRIELYARFVNSLISETAFRERQRK